MDEGAGVDDLIRDIQQRTGLSAEKVLEVVTMVTDYMRNALPDDLVKQVTAYLGAAAEAATAAAGSARSAASSATATASSGVSDVMGWATSLASSRPNAVSGTTVDDSADDQGS